MKKIFLVFSVVMFGAVASVSAELPKKVRDNFSDIIQDYCYSTVSYSLSDSIGVWDGEWSEGKAEMFHKTVGCIFEDALAQVTDYEKLVSETAFKSNLPIDVFEPEGECQEKFLALVQGEQVQNGFKSECARSEVEEISQIFSSCRVAETVLQEWCGYDFFLRAKMLDEESFREQGGDMGVSVGDRSLEFKEVKNKMERERSTAEVAVFDSITWYQETEYASRQNAWMVAVHEQLRSIQGDWIKLRSALGTFVDKFLNASNAPE